MKSLLLFTLVIGFVSMNKASAQDDYKPGCPEVLAISQVLAFGKEKDLLDQTHGLRRRLCSTFVEPGQEVKYDNGQVATTSVGTNGTTWYFANGKVFTESSNTEGATWLYPNGNPITTTAYSVPGIYLYSDGKTITQSAGIEGARCFDRKGNAKEVSIPSFVSNEQFDITGFLGFALKNCF